jgi:hypothetical protein
MHIRQLVDQYLPYAQKQMGYNKQPKINYLEDEQNASNPLGKTAFYNPSTFEVSVYITSRHPKDILRSVSHELVHHAQNCRGDLSPDKVGEMGEGYAQNNKHLRNMEREAFELGNMYFRDWCDTHKGKLMMEKVEKEKQPLNEWLNDERFGLLMTRFKIVSPQVLGEERKKKPDADGDGVPDYADKEPKDPKVGAKETKPKAKKGKVPPQLQKYVKSKQDKSKKDLEEKKMTKAEKKEEEKLGKEMGKAKVKSKMQKQYGKEKGEQVYYATKRKKAMENA